MHNDNFKDSLDLKPDKFPFSLEARYKVNGGSMLSNFDKGEGILECLDKTFKRFKEQTAIEFNEQQVSYSVLDGMANRLANCLMTNQLSKGSLIAVMLDDRIKIIATLIGILRSGCVFVPLDPESPKERLDKIITDLSPDCFIIQEKYSNLVTQIFNNSKKLCKIINLGGNSQSHKFDEHIYIPISEFLAEFSTEKPNVSVNTETICYIYYTSGSTGTPKGIVGQLKGISHLIKWEIETFNISPGWRFSQFTIPTFDAFFRDVLVPLCVGGTICIPPEKPATMGTTSLIDWIDSKNINLIHCVPSLFGMITSGHLEPQKLQSIEYILMAGESLPVSDVKKWMAVYGSRIKLVNLYGATETTMVKFYHQVQESDIKRGFIPIGKPMKGARSVVLDEYGNVCPRGVFGELYIRTPYRTLGYYNNSELTKEVFVKNPFSENPNDLIYKTGDLARVLNDGNFQLRGRKDNQVKIRGIRVELGEIENTLRNHPLVKSAVVLVREDLPGDQRLVTYVVPNQETSPRFSDLRRFLQMRLPEYMIPSAFVMLNTLPLTPNGKVDRQALPVPEMTRPDLEISFVTPRTPIEEMLAGIWASVLRVEQVGVDDNFFTLGGHSLLATQLISRVRDTLAVELPLRSLFENPTVSGLAQCIETVRSHCSSMATVPILPIARDGKIPIPLSFAQTRLWFIDQLEYRSALYNVPAAVRLQGRLNVADLEESFNHIISRHEALRTNIATHDGQPVQVIAATLRLTLPVVDLQALPEQGREIATQQLATLEAGYPFDLATEPLVRAKLFKLSEAEHVLVLTMHHIISDGWSMEILVQELTAVYSAFCNQLPLLLPELPIQYADFAMWQRQWLEGEVLESQLAYWKQQLDGIPALLELPTDRVRPTHQTYRGTRQTFAISKALSEALTSLSQREGATLFITLLATYNLLLYHLTRQDDICVGTPIANRNRGEIEGLIGFFANTLVLRTHFSSDPNFRELIGQIREVVLEAYAHQDLPFEKLVAELQPERNLSHMPLFQVLFQLHHTPNLALELSELTLSFLNIEREMVRYDLNLYLFETPKGFRGFFEYKTDLFDATTIGRMVAVFETILTTVVKQPDIKLTHLTKILDEVDKHQQMLKTQEFKQARHQKLGNVKRTKIISNSQNNS